MKDASLPVIATTLLLAVTFQTGLATNSFAQDTTTATTPARNSVFLEIGGGALLYSINYDRRVSEHLSLRTGVAGIPAISIISPSLLSPNMINYTIGNGAERLEIGIGFTAGITWQYEAEEDGTVLKERVVPTAAIGYRYQPVEDGWFIRGNFTPVLSGEGPVTWIGFSIGRTW